VTIAHSFVSRPCRIVGTLLAIGAVTLAGSNLWAKEPNFEEENWADSHNMMDSHEGHQNAADHGAHAGHGNGQAGDAHTGHTESQAHGGGHGGDHANHRSMKPASIRTDHISVSLPGADLKNRRSESVRLAELLATDKTVLLNFVFTSCNAICPIMSSSFSGLRTLTGPERDDYRLISISIDPEYDTPDRLTEYATRHRADDGDWHFLTGAHRDIVRVQRAFDAYRGSKMNHEPATYIWRRGQTEWTRLSGLATPRQLLTTLDAMSAASEAPPADTAQLH